MRSQDHEIIGSMRSKGCERITRLDLSMMKVREREREREKEREPKRFNINGQ